SPSGSNSGSAVTSEVVSIRPRPRAASPSVAVVPTPPYAPISHSPTRRSFMVRSLFVLQRGVAGSGGKRRAVIRGGSKARRGLGGTREGGQTHEPAVTIAGSPRVPDRQGWSSPVHCPTRGGSGQGGRGSRET